MILNKQFTIACGLVSCISLPAAHGNSNAAGGYLDVMVFNTVSYADQLKNESASVSFVGMDSAGNDDASQSESYAYIGTYKPMRTPVHGEIDWQYETFEPETVEDVFSFGQSAHQETESLAMVLTQDQSNDMGVINLNQSLPLAADDPFSVAFTFRVSHAASEGGDGFAFHMSGAPRPLGWSGGWLGMSPDSSKGCAVEFDAYSNTSETYPEFSDPFGQHVGINLDNSPISVVYAPMPAPLDEGVWQVWIEYIGVSNRLMVFMAPEGETRPSQPLISAEVDLPGYLGKDRVFFSFTGSTGVLSQRQEILSMSMNNTTVFKSAVGSHWLLY